LANAVFTLGLADHFGEDSGIKAACAHPGLAATGLQVTTAQDGGMGSGMWFMRFAQSQEDGSMPIVAACFDPSTKNGAFWAPGNMGGFKGPTKQIAFDKLSKDAASRKLLWEKSEEAVGAFKIN
jgi:protochlorophyllide reductase